MENVGTAPESDGAIWHGMRIMREDRRAMGIVAITPKFLATCASNNQAIIIDSCALKRATIAASQGSLRIPHGEIAWAVAVGVNSYRAMRRVTSLPPSEGIPIRTFQVYDVHTLYQFPEKWQNSGVSMLLTDLTTLGDTHPRNPSKNSDILRIKASHVSIIDPELELCTGSSYFDHSLKIRKLMARLATFQTPVPIVLWTERIAISMNTTLVRKRLGVEGLIYVEMQE